MTLDIAGPFGSEEAARSYLRSLDLHARCRFHVAEGWPGRWFVRESV